MSDRLTQIAKERFETGAYGSAYFLMAPETVNALPRPEPGPFDDLLTPLGRANGLLSIPVMLDASLPAGAWRLIDRTTGEEIESEGVAGSEEIDDDAVHGYFGLTYANYLVLHRTLMQSMPVEWQRRMVACLQQLDSAFDVERPASFIVEPATEVEYDSLTEAQMRDLAVEFNEETERYYDRDGVEREGWERALVRLGHDPVPHYNRGRARVPLSAAYLESVASSPTEG